MLSRAFPVLILVFLLIAVQNVTAQTEEPPSQILFNNVNIFDGKNRELQEGSSVLVQGNLIKATGGDLQASEDANVIEDPSKCCKHSRVERGNIPTWLASSSLSPYTQPNEIPD